MGQPRSNMGTRYSSFVLALALFAILCGAILVFAPSQKPEHLGEGCPGAEQVRRALGHVGEAAHALEANDYGQTRQYLQNARVTLERSLEQWRDTSTR